MLDGRRMTLDQRAALEQTCYHHACERAGTGMTMRDGLLYCLTHVPQYGSTTH